CGSAWLPGLPLDSGGPAQAQAGPLRAGLRILPGSLLRFAKSGSCCAFGSCYFRRRSNSSAVNSR
ncbi:hypothetical protein, partial [Paenibacillus sp. ALJ109b]|uniref:hypothetical protein n=1 Tax=Paenibacillus sp. ALJ109b TaxID=2709068 RepID=UPI0019672FE1